MTELEQNIAECARAELVAGVRSTHDAAKARKRTSQQELYIDRMLTLAIQGGGVVNATPREIARQEFEDVDKRKGLERANARTRLLSNIRGAVSRYRSNAAAVSVAHETGLYTVTFTIGDAAEDGSRRLEVRVQRASEASRPEEGSGADGEPGAQEVAAEATTARPAERLDLRISARTFHAPTFVSAYPLLPRAEHERITGCVWSLELPNGTIERWRAPHPSLSHACKLVGEYRLTAYVLLDGTDLPAYIATGTFRILPAAAS